MVDGIGREAALRHDDRVPFASPAVTADFFPNPSFIQWKCPPECPECAV
jgi:hypothetical protein